MSYYTIGFILVATKLIQLLVEAIIDKNAPLWCSLIFTGLFTFGSALTIVDLLRCGASIWLVLPIALLVAMALVILFRNELKTYYKNK